MHAPRATKAAAIGSPEEPGRAGVRKSPFLPEKFQQAGITPKDIRSLEDIQKIPFTTKDDLRETYPYGLLAVPEAEIEEVHMSSGTTGIPVVDAYTKKDIEVWSESMARTLSMAGATRNDIIQNAYGYGLFHRRTGGPLRSETDRSQHHSHVQREYLQTDPRDAGFQDHHSHLYTFLLFIPGRGRKGRRVDIRSLSLKAGCFGAEPWSENMREEIEEKLGLAAYDIYGLTENYGSWRVFRM
jgi:phenylacetate-CoA ligase